MSDDRTAEDRILENDYEGGVILDVANYWESVVGMTADDRVVYDMDAMAEQMVAHGEAEDLDAAYDWIGYNSVEGAKNIPNGPVLMRKFIF